MNTVTGKNPDKKTRILYIIEALLEYFVTLSISSTYVPKLCAMIGMSETLTPIIVSTITLGWTFQLITIFLYNKKPVKIWVTITQFIGHVLFALLWFVPSLQTNTNVKIVAFIIMIIFAQALNNIVQAPKTTWLMAFIQDEKRGRFTALKEIVSLLIGMLFTLGFGKISDINTHAAFMICGIIVLVSGVLHMLSLVFSDEKPAAITVHEKGVIKKLLGDKTILKILLLGIIWYVIDYMTMPLFATYQYSETGLNLSTFTVSIITAVAALIRAVTEFPFGKFADKYGFSKMLNICFLIQGAALITAMFTLPISPIYSVIACALYWCMYNAGYGGLNSAMFNLVFDYVKPENRTVAFAFKNAVNGLLAFVFSMVSSLVATAIKNANIFIAGYKIEGIHIFAAIGILAIIGVIMYNKFVIGKIHKVSNDNTEIQQ